MGRSLYWQDSCLFIPRDSANAKKNPIMNRLRFSCDIPLWLFKFFFKSVNVPSILLLVLGIPLRKEVREIEIHTVHGGTEPPMGELCLA